MAQAIDVTVPPFADCDTDADGIVDRSELASAFPKTWGKRKARAALIKLSQDADDHQAGSSGGGTNKELGTEEEKGGVEEEELPRTLTPEAAAARATGGSMGPASVGADGSIVKEVAAGQVRLGKGAGLAATAGGTEDSGGRGEAAAAAAAGVKRSEEEEEEAAAAAGAKGGGALKGKAELDALAAANPRLAKFVALGRFAHSRLQDVGVAFGELSGLASSPRTLQGVPLSAQTGDGAGGAAGGGGGGALAESWSEAAGAGERVVLGLLLTVKEASYSGGGGGGGGGEGQGNSASYSGEVEFVDTVYEAFVAVDKQAYARPHIALLAAWRLDGSTGADGGVGARLEAQPVPEPPPPPTLWSAFLELLERNGKMIVTVFGVLFFSSLSRLARVGITKAMAASTDGTGEEGPEQATSGGGGGGEEASGGSGGKAPKGDVGPRKRKGKK